MMKKIDRKGRTIFGNGTSLAPSVPRQGDLERRVGVNLESGLLGRIETTCWLNVLEMRSSSAMALKRTVVTGGGGRRRCTTDGSDYIIRKVLEMVGCEGKVGPRKVRGDQLWWQY